MPGLPDNPNMRPGVGRRAAIGALATSLLAAGLWPRRARSREAIPEGRVIVDYWEKWTGPEGEAVQGIVDRFNTAQDRIWVRRLAVSDIMSKAMVAIGGGDPPDIVGLYSYNIPQFAESGAIISPEDLATPTARLAPESYAPAVHRLLSHEGRQWAGVNTCYSLALYYNRSLFREAGLDPDRPPATIDELDAAADRLAVRTAGGRIARAGFLPNLPAWWPYFWPIMFGGRLYDPDAHRAEVAGPAGVAAYEWVASYPRRLGASATAEFGNIYNRSFHSPQDPFISGRVGMIVQGPWIANFIRLYAPEFDYGCTPVPTPEAMVDPDRPVGMLEADVLVIPRGARHPEAAFEFLCFTQRPDVQEQLATEHAKSSPMRSVSAGFAGDHPNRCVDVHDRIVKSPRVQILPQTRVWQQYADSMIGAFDAIWAGADVHRTLAAAQSRAQQLIDQSRQRRLQRAARSGRGAPA
ncbi:MAG: ABC transporter substrate-binding protein [Phycisphaerales bacterium]|nr:ABC transporter substrate-binding protein [Phycisphaerales bacterium]